MGELLLAAPLWLLAYLVIWAAAREFVELRQRQERKVDEALFHQRVGIAREVHDTVAHELTSLSMATQLRMARQQPGSDDLEFVLLACDSALGGAPVVFPWARGGGGHTRAQIDSELGEFA